MGARENKCQILQNDILHMKFSIIFLGSRKKLSLVLLQITNYIYSPLKGYKNMWYRLKYSGTRFCPLKIKITQSPDGLRLKNLGSFQWLQVQSAGIFFRVIQSIRLSVCIWCVFLSWSSQSIKIDSNQVIFIDW